METLAHLDTTDQAPEEAGRQLVFAFLARVLARPALRDELAFAASFATGEASINKNFAALRAELEAADEKTLGEHYHDLFIGVGRGELLPYGSYYLTGFLNEKPLAELRGDLDSLGFARAEGVFEPEDHIASLCDVMAQLIAGTAEEEFSIYEQERFFAAHLKPWAAKFFADLEAAKSAGPYRIVGTIGKEFMEIEEEGFGMVARA